MPSSVPKTPRSRRWKGQLHHSETQTDVGLARKQKKVLDADQNGDSVTRILIEGTDGKIREVDSNDVVDADPESVTTNLNQGKDVAKIIVHDADHESVTANLNQGEDVVDQSSHSTQPYRSADDSVKQNGEPVTDHDSVTANLYLEQDDVDVSVHPKQPYSPDDEFKFKWRHFVLGLLSAIFVLVDIYTDIDLTVKYFQDGFDIFGIVTAILVCGASVVVSAYSLYWYYLDYAVSKNEPTWLWVCRIVFSCLQLAILWR
ncbi:hypothetical protein SNE40_022035 [Patella caerulea]|uniref:XK-related protein n=1 Tax=Patella caerulea TaxID=87958 RepID=A0AAN8IYJ5_PATCE